MSFNYYPMMDYIWGTHKQCRFLILLLVGTVQAHLWKTFDSILVK